jgi:DNA-binding transcriptional ArsR family regulator
MLLSSKARLRVLETVAIEGHISIRSLSRSIGLNHSDTDRAVRYLVEAGLLLDEYMGKSRVVTSNFRRCDLQFIRGQGLEVNVI